MVHHHNLLFQGEVPEIQEEHLLYILEGLLPIVPEFPTCLATPYIGKLCLYQVYQIYFWFNLINMYSLVATIKSNCINCSYVQYAAKIAVFLLYVDRDQSVYDW